MSSLLEKVRSNHSSGEKGKSHYDVGRGDVELTDEEDLNEFEVFKKTTEGVDFRTVGWPRASVIFLKSQSCIVCVSRSLTQTCASHLRDRCPVYPDCYVLAR